MACMSTSQGVEMKVKKILFHPTEILHITMHIHNKAYILLLISSNLVSQN